MAETTPLLLCRDAEFPAVAVVGMLSSPPGLLTRWLVRTMRTWILLLATCGEPVRRRPTIDQSASGMLNTVHIIKDKVCPCYAR